MDNQNSNNMFSNMMGANPVPEVKDNNIVQGNGFNNFLNSNVPQNNPQDVNLNQMNSGNVPNATVGVTMGTTPELVSNNSTSIQPEVAPIELTPVFPNDVVSNNIPNTNLNNENITLNNENIIPNLEQNNMPEATNMGNLNFSLPGEEINNPNTNNNLNIEVGFTNNVNPMDNSKSATQPTNNILDFNMSSINNPSPVVDDSLNNNNPTNELNNNLTLDNTTSNLETPAPAMPDTNNEVKTALVDDNQTENVVSVKKYLGYIILFSIPIVGIIMLIVKAFDKKDKNINNFAKAQLLVTAIVVTLSVILMFTFTATINSLIENYLNDTGTTAGENTDSNDNYYGDLNGNADSMYDDSDFEEGDTSLDNEINDNVSGTNNPDGIFNE